MSAAMRQKAKRAKVLFRSLFLALFVISLGTASVEADYALSTQHRPLRVGGVVSKILVKRTKNGSEATITLYDNGQWLGEGPGGKWVYHDPSTTIMVSIWGGGGSYPYGYRLMNTSGYDSGVVSKSTSWWAFYPSPVDSNYVAFVDDDWELFYVESLSNTWPVLSDPTVSPATGDESTLFTYLVKYIDQDGDWPTTKNVVIDGSSFSMSLFAGSDPTVGLWYYSQGYLACSSHNYYFYFTDGNGGSDRLPPSGTYSGPEVTCVGEPDIDVQPASLSYTRYADTSTGSDRASSAGIPDAKPELSSHTDGAPGDYVPGEIVVNLVRDLPHAPALRDDTIETGIPSLDELNNRYQARAMTPVFRNQDEPMLSRIYLVTFSQQQNTPEARAAYANDAGVVWAEFNHIRDMDLTPSDSSFSQQWGLTRIAAESAWDIQTGDANVLIAVVDTGVDYDHPDLAANVWTNPDEIPGNGLDDDDNGYVDDDKGWDFVSVGSGAVYSGEDPGPRDNEPMDFDGHGTHVSGIAAAVTNNSKTGTNIAGTCWNCRIMPVRAGYKGTDGYGHLSSTDWVAAVEYAADNGASVINMSFGQYGYDSTEQTIMDYAYARGVVLVAAAGNDGVSTLHYPSAYSHVLAVAATDQDDHRSVWASKSSNYGSWVDVAAPGSSILSTYYNNIYATMGGTSMATPFAAGLAGLVVSQDPALAADPDQVAQIIIDTADNIDALNPGYEGKLGSGRINARAALVRAAGFTILNLGDGDLLISNIYVLNSSCWLSVTPPQDLPFMIPPGESAPVTVGIDSSCVGVGTHNDWIRIRSNDPDPDEDPLDVPVQLEVLERPRPDLIVSAPEPSAAPAFSVGQNVDWEISVTNQGNGPAQDNHAGFYLGGSCGDLSDGVETVVVPALAADSDPVNLHDDYTFQMADVGTRYMIAWVDYLDEEPNESNEENNTNCYGPFEVVGNDPPALSWTGEVNYTSDGLHPESGGTGDNYIYRIKYADADGDAPSYVRVRIKKGGTDIAGGPFTLSYASGSYSTGAIYSYTKAGLAAGTDYTYYFEAQDNQGNPATPTTELDAPDVSGSNDPPILSWTGEPNYASDGLHPESGSTGDNYVYRIKYTDADGDPPSYVRVRIKKAGTDIAGSPFTLLYASGSYSTGAIHSYTKAGLAAGTDYTYYFEAQDNQGNPATPTTQLDAPDVSSGCADSYEPDDTWGQANWIYDGSPQTHSICPVGDEDWVKFSLSAESEVVIETSGPNGDTRMWLYDSGLNEMEYDDDDGNGFFSRIDRVCGVDSLPAGTYYVRIDEFMDDGEIPSYDVTFTVVQTCETYEWGVFVPLVLKNYPPRTGPVSRISLNIGNSYDFSDGVFGMYLGGDLYLSSGLEFCANNVGQRGVTSLGDIGSTPLDDVSIPSSGYTRSCVPAVPGHTYVSLAHEGEEGNHIVFRVHAIQSNSVVIDYVYVFG